MFWLKQLAAGLNSFFSALNMAHSFSNSGKTFGKKAWGGSRKTEWTEIFTCILLTSNQMIFRVQFGINKHSQIFRRLQIALALRARAIFCSLSKICACLFIPNCPRNHLITYTNSDYKLNFFTSKNSTLYNLCCKREDEHLCLFKDIHIRWYFYLSKLPSSLFLVSLFLDRITSSDLFSLVTGSPLKN